MFGVTTVAIGNSLRVDPAVASSLMRLAPEVATMTRVEHDVRGVMEGESFSDDVDDVSGRHHADFTATAMS